VQFLVGLGSSRFCSSAEPGELAVDVREAERGGFLRVLFGRVLDRRVALVRHADRVHLVRIERTKERIRYLAALTDVGIRAEERQLREALGDEYEHFAAGRKRLVPGVW
jgi:hypothetical protein